MICAALVIIVGIARVHNKVIKDQIQQILPFSGKEPKGIYYYPKQGYYEDQKAQRDPAVNRHGHKHRLVSAVKRGEHIQNEAERYCTDSVYRGFDKRIDGCEVRTLPEYSKEEVLEKMAEGVGV